ncbi:MAG: DUF2177 family protein [Pseudomonadota bacterium]
MTIVILYLVTTVTFFVLDAIGLRFVIKPIFDRNIGHLYADPFRLVPAAGFYLAYVGGLLWFVSIPALRNDNTVEAFMNGAILGLLCYGTYEMTNYATLADWSLEQVIADCIWGAVLTGTTAWIGVTATRALT